MKESIRALLLEGIQEGKFPGCQYAIVTPNSIDFDYVGQKQLVPTVEATLGNEIYDVASLSKVVSTTTLTLKLVEKGLLSFETTVSSVLPRFKHEHITIKDLLGHCSGLPADIKNAKALKNKDEVFEKIYAMDLIYETGKDYVYSDCGFILLGEIIETITKEKINILAEAWIFKPLGMKDSSYLPDLSRVVPTELRADDVYQGLLKGKVHDEKSFAMGGLSGHAGLFSTASDLAIFIQSILNDEFVLGKEMTTYLFKPIISKEISGLMVTRTYGWLKPDKGSFAGHFHDLNETIGHTGFTGCHMFIDRKNKIGFVLLSNAVHPKRELNGIIPLRSKIGDIIYQKGGIL